MTLGLGHRCRHTISIQFQRRLLMLQRRLMQIQRRLLIQPHLRLLLRLRRRQARSNDNAARTLHPHGTLPQESNDTNHRHRQVQDASGQVSSLEVNAKCRRAFDLVVVNKVGRLEAAYPSLTATKKRPSPLARKKEKKKRKKMTMMNCCQYLGASNSGSPAWAGPLSPSVTK